MSRQIKTMEELRDSRLLYDKKLPAFGYLILLIVTVFLAAVVAWGIRTPKIDMITSSGTVKSPNKNFIMSPYTGEITDIRIKEGDQVKQGDVLFTVKSTDLDLQKEQMEGQKAIYEQQISQYQKLVQSIKADQNYFDGSKSEDSLYYSQYEAYKSQVAQQVVDTSSYKAYGYTDEQIQSELVKNQSKVTELYYNAIKSAEDSILQAQTQLDSLQAQLAAVGSGQEEYTVTANATGQVHMMAEYKEGMVVQAAAALASIASQQDTYMVEAYVSASDAAKVKKGDQVQIAVSGLMQSVYGTIQGSVVQMDSDSTTPQEEGGKSQSPYLKVAVQPDNTYLVSKKGDKVNLGNGMIVETRIQYDKVSYFNYVLEALGVLTR